MKQGFWTSVQNMVKRTDIILEVLDARMPELTRNRKMEHFISSCHKPLILIINKIDIVSLQTVQKIKEKYKDRDYVLVSSTKGKGIFDLIKKIKSKCKSENARVGIIGYPNTGKSSLVNRLSKRARVPTSSESGHTRGTQFVAGKGKFFLIDTPGVVPFEDRDEVLLGLMSGISPSKLQDPELVALELLNMFKASNPNALETYSLNPKLETEELLNQFGAKRNFLMKGAVVDERRAAIELLNEWHKGKIRL